MFPDAIASGGGSLVDLLSHLNDLLADRFTFAARPVEIKAAARRGCNQEP
jgi:hypothetical protein